MTHNISLPAPAASVLHTSQCIAHTINSTAFPNVAFSKPPSAWPTLLAISSVAKESTAARGIMAKKLMVKTTVEFQLSAPATIPMGTINRSTLM